MKIRKFNEKYYGNLTKFDRKFHKRAKRQFYSKALEEKFGSPECKYGVYDGKAHIVLNLSQRELTKEYLTPFLITFGKYDWKIVRSLNMRTSNDNFEVIIYNNIEILEFFDELDIEIDAKKYNL